MLMVFLNKPCNGSSRYLTSSVFNDPPLFGLTCGDPDPPSGNHVVAIGCTPVLDLRSTLSMNLWYPGATNYELLVSSDVAS